MINIVSKAMAAINFGNLNKTLSDFLPGNGATGAIYTTQLNNVYVIITEVIDYLLNLASVAAFFMILYSAFLYLTSYGDDSKVESAKKTMIATIVGICIISFSKIVIIIISNIFK